MEYDTIVYKGWRKNSDINKFALDECSMCPQENDLAAFLN